MGGKQWFRNWFIYLLVLAAIAALFFNIFQQPRRPNSISISALAEEVQLGMVREISASGTTLKVIYHDGTRAIASKASRDTSVEESLRNLGVAADKMSDVGIVYEQPAEWGDILTILSGLLPLIFVGALVFFLLRQSQSGNQMAKNFIKHTWKVDKPTITFADVGGMHEAKKAMEDFIAYLKDPKRFGEAGARMPRGILVQGPPGVGKGLFVQAVAGEAGAKLIHCSSAEFIELFIGVGSGRVRNLFEAAKKLAPVVVLLDELDTIGRRRGELSERSDASEQQTAMSQLFVELDELHANRGVVFFGVTNRPDLVDPALLRAGRLERQINIGVPNEEERLEILKILTRGRPLAQDVQLEEIARQTPGRTGADLASIVDQAAVRALKGGRANGGGAITGDDLQQALGLLKPAA